jgi:hypothetical protein
MNWQVVGGTLLLLASAAEARLDCVRDAFKTEMYRRACTHGGQMEAKTLAARFVSQQRAHAPDLQCTTCHRAMAPDYPLRPGGLERFQQLAASANPQPVRWVAQSDQANPEDLPESAVGGGKEGARTLYICRAQRGGGTHPGKVVGGTCSIGFMGLEHRVAKFEILAGPPGALSWVRGGSPQATGALAGAGLRLVKGHATGLDLPVCRARVLGWQHPGKLVKGRCHIGYGGREMRVRNYELLIRR